MLIFKGSSNDIPSTFLEARRSWLRSSRGSPVVSSRAPGIGLFPAFVRIFYWPLPLGNQVVPRVLCNSCLRQTVLLSQRASDRKDDPEISSHNLNANIVSAENSLLAAALVGKASIGICLMVSVPVAGCRFGTMPQSDPLVIL